MPTAFEYFTKDKPTAARFSDTRNISGDREGIDPVTIHFQIVSDFEARVKYVRLHIPDSPLAFSVVLHFLQNFKQMQDFEGGISIRISLPDTSEALESSHFSFQRRLVVYTETELSDEAHAHLLREAGINHVYLTVRDRTYFDARRRNEAPMAFISHDSRDKDAFVRSLASSLEAHLCSVWYDEFSLQVGDSLRDSIERGIKNCRHCIVVISPSFISNSGWTRVEFDSVFQRELLVRNRLILPIWHDVSKQQVYDYAPWLLDRVALPSSLGADEVARRISNAINANS